jgi:flagellar L-ring protein precursor FlgH
MNRPIVCALLALSTCAVSAADKQKKKGAAQAQSGIEQYMEELKLSEQSTSPSAGSLWTPTARLLDVGSDLRASRAGDIVTILVEENSSAVAKGTTNTKRNSAAKASIASVGGMSPPALAGLVTASGDRSLTSDGETSRENSLRTSLTARVSQVLPNGFLLIEGSKVTAVNSETQVVSIRGVVRPFDISTGNVVHSDRVALMEIKVNGKGVVDDAVKRPNFIYRLLLGLIPF